MKQQILNWSEVELEHECKDRLQLRLSKPSAVYVEVEGAEVLLGYGTDFDAEIKGPFTVKVEKVKDLRVFAFCGHKQSRKSSGEVFTNLDRQPLESGNLAEVTKAQRLFRLEQKQVRMELAQEMAALRAERRKVAESDAAHQKAVEAAKEREKAETSTEQEEEQENT